MAESTSTTKPKGQAKAQAHVRQTRGFATHAQAGLKSARASGNKKQIAYYKKRLGGLQTKLKGQRAAVPGGKRDSKGKLLNPSKPTKGVYKPKPKYDSGREQNFAAIKGKSVAARMRAMLRSGASAGKKGIGLNKKKMLMKKLKHSSSGGRPGLVRPGRRPRSGGRKLSDQLSRIRAERKRIRGLARRGDRRPPTSRRNRGRGRLNRSRGRGFVGGGGRRGRGGLRGRRGRELGRLQSNLRSGRRGRPSHSNARGRGRGFVGGGRLSARARMQGQAGRRR